MNLVSLRSDHFEILVGLPITDTTVDNGVLQSMKAARYWHKKSNYSACRLFLTNPSTIGLFTTLDITM